MASSASASASASSVLEPPAATTPAPASQSGSSRRSPEAAGPATAAAAAVARSALFMNSGKATMLLVPTRGQAELDGDGVGDGDGTTTHDNDAAAAAAADDDDDDGTEASINRGRGRREEPRSVEELGPVRVLYEGHGLLIIDKPPDVRMQGPFDMTVETLVRRWCPSAGAEAAPSLKYAHQLDYATSGVLCIGLNRRVAAAAGDLFMRRLVSKEYVALLEGHVEVEALPWREEAAIFDEARGSYVEGRLPGIRLAPPKRAPHKAGVVYKPAPSYYRDMQLAAQRKKKDKDVESLSALEAAVLATKWRDARAALPEVVAECEALGEADRARAMAAMANEKEKQKRALEEAGEGEGPGEDGEGEAAPTEDLGAFRRPRDPPGTFVVDVAITELKNDFRVRLGHDHHTATDPEAVYNTGPRRARTLGRVLAHGHLRLPGVQQGEEGQGQEQGQQGQQGRPVTKVLLRPVTGRRHQLRVHALCLGNPIVGDTTYTGDASSPRMMLHAARLTLPFPPNKGPGCTVSAATDTDPFEAFFQPLPASP